MPKVQLHPDHLSGANSRAYDSLADLVESRAEGGVLGAGHGEFDVAMFAAPLLAWSRFTIPSGPLAAGTLATARTQLQAHAMASGTKVALVDFLYSPDQLPRGFVETYRLANQLAKAAADGKDAHVDPRQLPETTRFISDTRYLIGAVVAPLLGAFNGFLFGWAATPVNPARVRRGITIRTADLLISVAGPVSNMLLVGLAIGLFYGLDALQAEWTEPLRRLAAYLVVSNIFLAAFNLLPIPPLDGYHVLAAKAPDAWRPALDLIEQYSFMLFLLIFFGAGRFIAPLLGLLVPDEIRTYMLGAR